MRVKCLVPDCAGIIDSPSPGTTPCPECAKRVQVMPRLQEQIRALQGQVLELQAGRLARSLPLLRALAKKSLAAAELKTSLRTKTNLNYSLLQLERRGLVVVKEFRRIHGRSVGTALWGLSALGERLVQEHGDTNGAKPK